MFIEGARCCQDVVKILGGRWLGAMVGAMVGRDGWARWWGNGGRDGWARWWAR